MANTPFIQFPCGEWAPGFGPDYQPCDPTLPGGCDDVDVVIPGCITCGEPPGGCVGPPEVCGPPGIPPSPGPGPSPGPSPSNPPIPPGGPGPGGGGEGQYMILEECQDDAGGVHGTINITGHKEVEKWKKIQQTCDTVILNKDSPEGQGCETTIIGPTLAQGIHAFDPYVCETCPCYKIKGPFQGNPLCEKQIDGDGSNEINNVHKAMDLGTHCPESVEYRCCPNECDKECPPSTGTNCPGCKEAPVGPPIGPPEEEEEEEREEEEEAECRCGIIGASNSVTHDTAGAAAITAHINNATLVCTPYECGPDAIGGDPYERKNCFCCKCTITYTFPQRCQKVIDTDKNKFDSGKTLAETMAQADAQGKCPNSCPEVQECFAHPEAEAAGCEIDCVWKKEPGEKCDCVGEGAAAPGPSPGSPGVPGDITATPGSKCPDAVYECCWDEVCCSPIDTPYTREPEQVPGGTAPSVTGGGKPCGCLITLDIRITLEAGNEECPDGCCNDCDDGSKCMGKKVRVNFTAVCRKGQPAIIGGDDLCGCSLPIPGPCPCPGPGGCNTINYADCYMGCNCAPDTGGDDRVEELVCGENTLKIQGGDGFGRSGGRSTNHETGGKTENDQLSTIGDEEITNSATGKSFSEERKNQEKQEVDRYLLGLEEKPSGIEYSDDMNSEFQINIALQANTPSKEYNQDFVFKTVETHDIAIQTRKGSNVISKQLEIKSENFKEANRLARFTNNPNTTLRENRTHSTFHLDDKHNLYNVKPNSKFTMVPNDRYLNIFGPNIHTSVKEYLDYINTTKSWDEKYIKNLTLLNIRRSLNKEAINISKTFVDNPHYGFTVIDFYSVIQRHLFNNDLEQLDLNYYKNFVKNQAEETLFAVDTKQGSKESKERLALQVAVTYAMPLDPSAHTGVNKDLAKLYRTDHEAKLSRIPVVTSCGISYLSVTNKDQLPIVYSDGGVSGIAIGTDTSDSNTIPLVTDSGCETNIPLTTELSHAFRLNHSIRQKVLALLDIKISNYLSAEYSKDDNPELDYSLTDSLPSYLFLKAKYSTTETFTNYNDSDFLIMKTREYELVTDESEIKQIIENQLGKQIYVNHADPLIHYIQKSEKASLRWIDFTLNSFGVSEDEKFPVIVPNNPAYLFVVPTALSQNDIHHVKSTMEVTESLVKRTLPLVRHLDKTYAGPVYKKGKGPISVEQDGN
jgi:hypothetical protein